MYRRHEALNSCIDPVFPARVFYGIEPIFAMHNQLGQITTLNTIIDSEGVGVVSPMCFRIPVLFFFPSFFPVSPMQWSQRKHSQQDCFLQLKCRQTWAKLRILKDERVNAYSSKNNAPLVGAEPTISGNWGFGSSTPSMQSWFIHKLISVCIWKIPSISMTSQTTNARTSGFATHPSLVFFGHSWLAKWSLSVRI